jgi:hypothetical protein
MTSATGWLSIVSLILFLGLMAGFWIGLAGLWHTRRGASWWLMAVGTAFNTIGPIAYAVGTWMLIDSLGRTGSGGLTASSSFGFNAWVSITMGIAGLLIPTGVILFAIGFAIHGQRAARVQERAGELEQLTAAMSAEIDRLKAGGPEA